MLYFSVQVVGVKDERLGEQVCACIKLKEGHTSSAEEIRAFCKGQVRVGDDKMTQHTQKEISTALQFVFSPTRYLTSRSRTM